ncbi:hypothetical protein SUGI_0246230 [Cryptomeria japonica]|nr:hypothetical protein SUGI_0246230 [Cryptomeria japonica]
MGQSISVGNSLNRDESVESSQSISSSSGILMDNTRALDLEKKFLFCSNLVREDPHGYSSRVYYRSNVNVGEGVPFQWEAQPGKPKSNNMQDGFNILPLSPPPSSFVSLQNEKKLRALHKQTNKKSKKIHGSFLACSPFSIKKVW